MTRSPTRSLALHLAAVLLLLAILSFATASGSRPKYHQPFVRRQTSEASPAPTVDLTQGSITGYTQLVDNQPIDTFLGVPYARPPVGPLRFARTQPVLASNSSFQATKWGSACNAAEDCLVLNIWKPSVAPGRKLPVFLHIHGGAWFSGSGRDANSSKIVAESIKMNTPIICISINYRLGAFGFLAGSSVVTAAKSNNAALNPGLYDVRMSLRWVKANIEAFGGDPDQVTIRGSSAGAFLTGNQLFANGGNTEGLFHAVVLASGVSPPNTLPPNHPSLEKVFADLSNAVGCPPKPTSLSCLRSVSYTDLAAAAKTTFGRYTGSTSVGLYPFTPVQDMQVNGGYWYSAPPRTLIEQGRFANVPVISGLCLDEGTDSAPKSFTSGPEIRTWFRKLTVANPSNQTDVNATMDRIFSLYPNDVRQGSPYYSEGTAASLAMTNRSDPFFSPATNQYKRAAALYASWRYEAFQRRFLLKRVQKGGQVWSSLFAQHDKDWSLSRGVYHTADNTYVFGDTDGGRAPNQYVPLSRGIQRALIAFVNNFDPGSVGSVVWPQWTTESRATMRYKGMASTIVRDDVREHQLEFLMSPDVARIF
ncbi:hypothetical protein V8E36_000878 [Tilletia maclaganii]